MFLIACPRANLAVSYDKTTGVCVWAARSRKTKFPMPERNPVRRIVKNGRERVAALETNVKIANERGRPSEYCKIVVQYRVS